MVWTTIFAKIVIGPFLRRETITSEVYLDILPEFLAVQIALENRENTPWFMQDCCHTNRTSEVFHFLYEHFDDRVIDLDY